MVTGVARRGGGWQSRVDGAAQWGDVVARRPRRFDYAAGCRWVAPGGADGAVSSRHRLH